MRSSQYSVSQLQVLTNYTIYLLVISIVISYYQFNIYKLFYFLTSILIYWLQASVKYMKFERGGTGQIYF